MLLSRIVHLSLLALATALPHPHHSHGESQEIAPRQPQLGMVTGLVDGLLGKSGAGGGDTSS